MRIRERYGSIIADIMHISTVSCYLQGHVKVRSEPSKRRTASSVSIFDAHLFGHNGAPAEIEQAQQKTIEHHQDAGSDCLAHLTMIFAQGHIPAPMQAVFHNH